MNGHSHSIGTALPVSAAMLALVWLTGCTTAGTAVPASAIAGTTSTTSVPTTSKTVEVTTTTTQRETVTTTQSSSPRSTIPTGTYAGSASITLTVYDYCGPGGQRQAAGTQTYSLPAQLIISAPKQDDRGEESNPFSLELHAGIPASAGAVSLVSSSVATVSGSDLSGNPRDPRLLLTYWRLDYSGSRLSGELIDTHEREAVVRNLFNGARPVVPCRPELGMLPGGYPSTIGTGSTLQGTLDSSGAGLAIDAATTDSLFSFTIQFST
jgi:hypothetical protein